MYHADKDGNLSFQEAVFERVACQSERDDQQDRMIRELQARQERVLAELDAMREFVKSMGALSDAVSRLADRISDR